MKFLKVGLTFGVRSACRKTVTLAFNVHIGPSLPAPSGPGNVRLIDVEWRMQRAASISAALSRDSG